MTVKHVAMMHIHLTYHQWMPLDGHSLHAVREAACRRTAAVRRSARRSYGLQLAHALTCNKGGNRIHRHNTVQNALQSVAMNALGSTAFHVQRQPWIVPQCT